MTDKFPGEFEFGPTTGGVTYISTGYKVKFVNSYEGFEKPQVTEFTAFDPEHVKLIISALSAFYSGDPYECFINGEKAVTEGDWGLA